MQIFSIAIPPNSKDKLLMNRDIGLRYKCNESCLRGPKLITIRVQKNQATVAFLLCIETGDFYKGDFLA